LREQNAPHLFLPLPSSYLFFSPFALAGFREDSCRCAEQAATPRRLPSFLRRRRCEEHQMSQYLERNLLRMRTHEFTCGRASCKCLSCPCRSLLKEALRATAFIKVISFAKLVGRSNILKESYGVRVVM